MSKIVRVKPKGGEEKTYYDVTPEGEEPHYWRLTLYDQTGKTIAQFDKGTLDSWEVVQKPG